MLNRLTGWLLVTQVSYVFLFVFVTIADVLSRHAIFAAISHLRGVFHIQNTYVRLTDWIFYPIAVTTPLNIAFLLAFLWSILRRRRVPTLASDCFSIFNAAYIAACGWIILIMFTDLIGRI